MKSTDLDKRLSAFLDGALADGKRDRLERELEQDPALRKQLGRTRALSQLVRESWTEGPPAPAPEVLLAALRPEIAAISRERRARPAWRQTLERARIRLSNAFGPMPIATSAAAAFLLALAFLPRPDAAIPGIAAVFPSERSSVATESTRPGAALPRAATRRPDFAPANVWQDPSTAIYDVAPREAPAMLFHNTDGSTILWLLERDDLSFLLQRFDRWS